MATVKWAGKAQAIPDFWTALVATATATEVRSLTINNQKVQYTVVTGDTQAIVAAALLAAYQAIQAGEWRECTVSLDPTNSARLLITGPSDGAPVGLTASSGMTLTHVTTSTGPHHASNVLNYDTGALPVDTNDFVFETGEVWEGPKYDLDALDAVTFASVTRLPSFKGVVGLPPVSRGGYYEYRSRYFRLDTPILRLNQLSTDAAFHWNVQSLSASAPMAVTLIGSGQAVPADALDIYDLFTGSTLSSSGGSVSVCSYVGQTAALSVVTAIESSVRLGVGCTLATLDFTAGNHRISADFATLTQNAAARTVVDREAECTTAGPTVGAYVQNGTLAWESSGTPGVVEIGSDATVDFGNCPGCPATTFRMNERSTLNDPANRVGVPYTVKLINCSIQDVTIASGTGREFEVDALS